MKKINAQCFVEVAATCPYCGALDDILDDVRDVMDDNHRAHNIDKEITCSECNEIYIVENVNY
jgi:metal-sulfur cluster biosynthetic enzyme